LQRISVCSIPIASTKVRALARRGLCAIFEIRYLPETGSTNDDAAALLGEPGSAGLVILTDFQRAGRGRRARSWIAPPGSSLLCTAILPRTIPAAALWAVPLWTALAVADGVLAACGAELNLQWPNDLLLGGRKCCGILCISRVTGNRAWAGCGTGLNVDRPPDPGGTAAIEAPPAFLSDAAPGVARRAVLDAILAAYERRLGELDDAAGVARAWERRAALDGTPYRIHVDGESEPFDAVARRIAADGSLVVSVAGTERSIALADARIVR
jgi:BirA family biotin operon repressor/biotin-[acetyl-CoA-carboxylase] ligase